MRREQEKKKAEKRNEVEHSTRDDDRLNQQGEHGALVTRGIQRRRRPKSVGKREMKGIKRKKKTKKGGRRRIEEGKK